MFYHDDELQYPVEVEEPNPAFAKMLQQAIGGVEGEMRVALQYLFQAWNTPADDQKYRTMLMETATEEIGHIEMLATAVAKNLQDAPAELRGEMSQDAAVNAAMQGYQPRQFLSAGMGAMPVDSNGNAFSGNFVVASGNLAADMYANVMAEATGRTLATRLWKATDDPGMKDMLSYLIGRDAMHQNQWLAALQDLGDPEDPLDHLPVPNSFPQEEENQEFNYEFISTTRKERDDPERPWTQGDSVDSNDEFSFGRQPGGGEFDLPSPDPRVYNEVK